MKILEIIQTIFGLTTIISFPAVFISAFIFNSAFFGFLFFSLFWMCLAVSLYMNKFTRNSKYNLASYLVIFFIFSIGAGTMIYFLIQIAPTKYTSETKDFVNNQVSFNFDLNEEGKPIEIEGRFILHPSLLGITEERLLMLELTQPDGTKQFRNVTLVFTPSADQFRATSKFSVPKELIEIESQKGTYNLKISTLTDEEERNRLNGESAILNIYSANIRIR